ncbi:hypothetical protein VOLCADRAFT_108548 [Volvox carteri f. nagariensis]|uniref:Uncharacterized protein n=1 Tax=Volvox carteri f. nagariensis TaxID=3068 RepID=D8UKU3_VOLCA|nr:uncharacterized protein VOLCADRAFT_108548 [Volvox carteri f. nagariensis]EFJ39659.1 hypothetical protein VOLCADRAFT_108548 [Volvox carteri f. nagariensis]|eukprot:XP_002959280.1 hypothetical protein VOLCADRAFT_108548 [Volvox carteri f. nagariensis]
MESPTKMTLESLVAHTESPIAFRASRALNAINLLPAEMRHGLGSDKSFEENLQQLTNQRSTLPDKDPLLSRLDDAIIPLVEIQRGMFGGGPYDISSEPAPPSPSPLPAQSLLLDLKESNLIHEVSALLGVPYLSEAPSIEPVKQVEGILWGPANRPLVCMPAQIRGNIINVFLLVDTGAPVTEFSPSVFTALGCDSVPMAAMVNLGGCRRTQVRLCDQGEHSNHRDIPILGADFMKRNKCLLQVDYLNEMVTICFQ